MYSWVVISGNSENRQSRLWVVGISEFPEFPGFLVKVVAEGLSGIFPVWILVFCLINSAFLKGLVISARLIVCGKPPKLTLLVWAKRGI